jgi:hypothetical protein
MRRSRKPVRGFTPTGVRIPPSPFSLVLAGVSAALARYQRSQSYRWGPLGTGETSPTASPATYEAVRASLRYASSFDAASCSAPGIRCPYRSTVTVIEAWPMNFFKSSARVLDAIIREA